ncbi:MAG: NAD(+) diphosphatase [Sphingomonadales bacterium]|nr:NAD(+) diphosphatase [Sphingomonadales bacterium]
MNARTIAFSGSGLDRADHLRGDAAALARLMDGRARLLRLDGIDPVCGDDGGLAWGTLAEADASDELIFLGIDGEGRGCFAVAPGAASASVAPPNPRLWQVLGALPREPLATYGVARALAGWHARHRFCARCGSPTRLAKGGWQRDCQSGSCRAEHFPRTDPVAIMLVEHEGDVLLGRQPRFPPKRYSALAGFIEPGETIEEAVAREVFEEAGLRVDAVTYVCSQPWPFPSSLMIACHARARGRDLAIDSNELDDARWFSRAEIAEAMVAGERGESGQALGAPPPHAVAWHLLDWWLRRG